jgi:hypothetical protein
MTYSFFLADGSGAPASDTRVRVIHDYHAVYFGFTVMEKDMAALTAAAAGRDDAAITGDDAVAVVLEYADAAGQPRTARIAINSANAVADALDGQPDWNLDGLQTAVRKRPGMWDVEIAVPYAGLGVAMPRYHDTWQANFFRNKAANGDQPAEQSVWLPGNAMGELRYGRDLLVYVWSKRPFYAPDEVMVFNFSDKLRRLAAQYYDLDGNPVGAEMTVHLGPGHRRQHYAMERPPQGAWRLVVRDRDAMQGDSVIMSIPRPQFGK